jgi:hypothetical protein
MPFGAFSHGLTEKLVTGGHKSQLSGVNDQYSTKLTGSFSCWREATMTKSVWRQVAIAAVLIQLVAPIKAEASESVSEPYRDDYNDEITLSTNLPSLPFADT